MVPDSHFVDSGSVCLRVYVVRGFSYAGFSARLWFVDSRFHGNDEAGRRQGAVPLAGDKSQLYRVPLPSPWTPAFAGVTSWESIFTAMTRPAGWTQCG